MIAEFKGIHSPDVDLPSFYPEDSENFSVFVQVFFGPQGEEGSESFNFTICSVNWLKNYYRGEYVVLKDILLVPDFDYSKIEERFKKLASSTSGKNWSEIANKLSRFGGWEFEDYKK